MATTEESMSAPRRGGGRGRGRGRGRGDFSSNESRAAPQGARRGGRGGFSSPQKQAQQQRVPAPDSNGATAPPGQAPAPAADSKGKEATEEDGDAEVCFICASEVVHHSVPPCNHRTCHICSLRMRALYKTNDCPHCRVSLLCHFPL